MRRGRDPHRVVGAARRFDRRQRVGDWFPPSASAPYADAIQLSLRFCCALKCIARWLPIVSNGSPYSLTEQPPPIDALPQSRLPACSRPKLCPISCVTTCVTNELVPLIHARRGEPM